MRHLSTWSSAQARSMVRETGESEVVGRDGLEPRAMWDGASCPRGEGWPHNLPTSSIAARKG
jgi:hypothetical protein